jgi:hypothetical protein
MTIQMARFKVKGGCIKEFEKAARRLFAGVREKRPKAIRYYTMCRLSDGITYLGLLELDDGANNPLPELPEGKNFQEDLANWIVEPPVRDQLTLIGSYQLSELR